MAITTEQTEIQLKITVPTALLKELEAIIPAEQRDQFFADLLERELRRRNFRRAWERAAGAWSDEAHPELTTAADIESYVRHLRDRNAARSWDEIIAESKDD
ncbi:MAG: hypothetical protein KDJ97_31415 [Anaerolineae bacterium]|nr:hypothetical protein [Anaerolineae bacterium]